MDPVRALQHTLYRAAKADPGRRFHALWDKVIRRDVLWRAWFSGAYSQGMFSKVAAMDRARSEA
jgi:RNA-directed DNA polymerase